VNKVKTVWHKIKKLPHFIIFPVKKILGFQKKEKKAKLQNGFDKKIVLQLRESRAPSLRQLKQLPKVLSKKDKKIIKISLLITVICLSIIITQAYFQFKKIVPSFGGEYREVLIGKIIAINPWVASENDVDADITSLVYSGLLKYNEDLELIPDLATSWEISPDQKTYTFHLRKDVEWHHCQKRNDCDQKFGADDIAFTIESIRDKELNSPLYRTFAGVIVEKIDESTVQFKLQEPFSPFLSTLTIGILPAHLWQETSLASIRLAPFSRKPVGTGPFKFKSLITDKSGNIKEYTLERNEEYYEKKPYLETISFEISPDFESAVEALKTKQVLGISYLPQDLHDEIVKIKDLQKHSFNMPQYTAVFFNQKKNENLKDTNLREALLKAVDKNKIIQDYLDGKAQTIDGPILPGFIGYHPDIKKFPYNTEEAEAALEKAGWKKVEGQDWRQADETSLEITLTTIDQKKNMDIAQFIKESWEKIGIKTNLHIVPSTGNKIIKDVIKPREYEALLYGQIIGSDPDPYAFWHSSQIEYPGLNLAIFAQKDADQVLEEARQTSDAERRSQKYVHFQNIMTAYIPALFLYNPTYTYIVDNKVQGIKHSRIFEPANRFIGIEDWYVKTKNVFRK